MTYRLPYINLDAKNRAREEERVATLSRMKSALSTGADTIQHTAQKVAQTTATAVSYIKDPIEHYIEDKPYRTPLLKK